VGFSLELAPQLRRQMAALNAITAHRLESGNRVSTRGANVIFWDVDTQIDFLLPGGRLYVPGAEKIIPNLHELTAWAGAHCIPIISSACAHLPGDPEMRTYGPHCVAGTPGQQKIPETLLPNRLVVPNRRFELPDLRSFQQVIVEKQAFDPFTNPNTEQVLQQFGNDLSIVMYGVTTDICVACAADALLDRGRHVQLVSNAVAALDEKKAASFLDSFRKRGGMLVRTRNVLRETSAA
jgi:nicotinamidase/pyrazinamidase